MTEAQKQEEVLLNLRAVDTRNPQEFAVSIEMIRFELEIMQEVEAGTTQTEEKRKLRQREVFKYLMSALIKERSKVFAIAEALFPYHHLLDLDSKEYRNLAALCLQSIASEGTLEGASHRLPYAVLALFVTYFGQQKQIAESEFNAQEHGLMKEVLQAILEKYPYLGSARIYAQLIEEKFLGTAEARDFIGTRLGHWVKVKNERHLSLNGSYSPVQLQSGKLNIPSLVDRADLPPEVLDLGATFALEHNLQGYIECLETMRLTLRTKKSIERLDNLVALKAIYKEHEFHEKLAEIEKEIQSVIEGTDPRLRAKTRHIVEYMEAQFG